MAATEWDVFSAKEKTWKNGPGCIENRTRRKLNKSGGGFLKRSSG